MRGKKTLNTFDDSDMDLFRREVGDVRRLDDDRVPPARRRPRPVPRQTLDDQRQVLRDLMSEHPDDIDLETGDELVFVRSGLQARLLRKLRRGQFSVGAELDLHGLTVSQAHAALTEFLRECRSEHKRCVRIIHGKGLGSKNGKPILKGKLDRWLRLRNDVVAFSSARPVDGGTGAVYVLLKR